MPSTYTSNLFLQKPATGEQAGTWGVTANNNYDFIDDAIDGNLQIPVSASGYILSTQQDVTSEGRNKVLIFTGNLTAGVTVQIQPNTAKKLYLVTNNTTGGQALSFQQGAGGTFTLQNGYSAMIYTDGAGLNAKVDGALYNPQFASVSTGVIRSTAAAPWPATGKAVAMFYQPSTAATLPDTGFIQCLDFATSNPQVFLPLHIDGHPISLNTEGSNVGIGTLSPAVTLDVQGPHVQSYGIARFKSTTNTGYITIDTTGTGGGGGIFFYMNNVWVGEIDAYGGMDFWTQNFVSGVAALQLTAAGLVNVSSTLAVDTLNRNNGLGPSLLFGPQNSGEGIGSVRIAGQPNQWGLDFYTNGLRRVIISNSGNLGVGTINAVDPVTISGALGNQLRMVYGNYGVFFRVDDGSFYTMVTNSGTPFGGWSNIFPLQINLASRTVGIYNPPSMNFALNVGGDVNISGSYRVNGVPLALDTVSQLNMPATTSLPPNPPADVGRIFFWRQSATVPPTIVFEVNWQGRPYYLYVRYDLNGAASWWYATTIGW